ncbi:ABC transporter permease [Virgisporangium aliadipatigenens]|uniref:ABC transporter permease n=1 Tax=Virgisporangium aliadipatigenens TaxID=741659 RepID=A0A8J4DP54_9ACTN|nr:ABC transporter permease [Virgisporangium aliadipatigenens]GIJ45580.1 ABC transporter permease [Virgisporangium aliadipatigenens]
MFRVGAVGLRTRPLRVFLSALGIAIGIAAMVAVVGISASGRAALDRELAAIGTNILTAGEGKNFGGERVALPRDAPDMAGRISGVEAASAIGRVEANVYRTDRIPAGETNALSVLAARTDLLGTLGGSVATGVWLTDATARGQAVVLGARTARLLGVHTAGPDTRVFLGGQWFTVAGILAPQPLAPELDTAALVGWPVAEETLGFDGHGTTVYVRTDPERLSQVRALLARTVNPAGPNEVTVARPSDALAARKAADRTLTALLLGLGGVALLVGGVGVANTMIISVLERRAEIGLRRALGATKGQVRGQFFTESLLLSALGGAGGVLLGVAVTGVYAAGQGWPLAVPWWAQVGAVGATVVIGGTAGLYPAVRAARLPPTEALSA